MYFLAQLKQIDRNCKQLAASPPIPTAIERDKRAPHVLDPLHESASNHVHFVVINSEFTLLAVLIKSNMHACVSMLAMYTRSCCDLSCFDHRALLSGRLNRVSDAQ